MPPLTRESPLVALDPKTLGYVPVQVGDKVAFHEEHAEQPGMYGLIVAIGLDMQAAAIRMDVHVIDPFDSTIDYDAPTVRIGLEEIQ